MDSTTVVGAVQVAWQTGFLNVVPSIGVLIAAGFSAVAANRASTAATQAANASAVSMYAGFNDFVVREIKDVGPLTPYSKSSNTDGQRVRMRYFFLQLFNRWCFDQKTRHEKKRHVTFRVLVFGSNYNNVAQKLEGRKYVDRITAEKCQSVLKEIYLYEPYFDEPFWDAYFSDFWSPALKAQRRELRGGQP